MKSLYIFGDSIAFGQFISPHKTWTTLLSNYWSQIDKSNLMQVTAYNGETTSEALKRFSYCVLNHSPNYVWIQYGLNDANFWPIENDSPRTSPDNFMSNLEEMIHSLKNQGGDKVFLATNHRVSKTKLTEEMRIKYSISALHFNDLIRKIAKDHSSFVELVDIEYVFSSKFQNLADYLLGDGVHLNLNGHQEFYEIAREHLENSI